MSGVEGPDTDAGTLVGYFYSAQDARRAHNTLRCEFESLSIEPYASPSGAGPTWLVRVVVPAEGPYLHGPDAEESMDDVVSRWNGVMTSVPAVEVVADRGDGVYLLDVGGGMGQIADTTRGVLFPPQLLQAILARGYWEECEGVVAADVLARCRSGS